MHQHYYPIDVVLHAGGQAWMGDAFEDAWELLRRRAMEPVLCADGGWREAQEEAEECLREVRVGEKLPVDATEWGLGVRILSGDTRVIFVILWSHVSSRPIGR